VRADADPLTIRIVRGDCRDVLKQLEAGSVQCCVTSPPYFGLRDYGTGTWSGGDPACDHRQGRPGAGRADGVVDDRAQRNRDGVGAMGGDCRKCGAVRIDQQIGLEASPDAYVAEMVAVFREVWRVLRDDGTVWLNLGDSYANDTKWGGSSGGKHVAALHGDTGVGRGKQATGLKSKDLMMIPARVALALQADGWYLRSDVIWHKPNPMPEPVTDRPTSSHEHIFLLTKQPAYFYDADAVKEPADPFNGSLTRNLRNVWTIAIAPYPEAHFATFPPDLAERCIKAGSKTGDTILDPFFGAGTTGLVADRLGRHAIGIDLNGQYVAMSENRIRRDSPLFAEVIST
jgi:DNA modification methylase